MRPGVSGRSRRSWSRGGLRLLGARRVHRQTYGPSRPGVPPHQPLSPAPLLSVTPRRYPGLISAALGPIPCGVTLRPAPRGPAAEGHARRSLDLLAQQPGGTRLPSRGGTASGTWRRWDGVAWPLWPRPAIWGSIPLRPASQRWPGDSWGLSGLHPVPLRPEARGAPRTSFPARSAAEKNSRYPHLACFSSLCR